ncbi:Phosphoribosyl amino imidazole carboxylase ATPase subunit [Corynebacterium kutscheri]|uniref:N5-carboxyaminoimidazole ribonucleotide synthase n=1 Tax=Corynebacterium kutscheri TaxID=35755 RepID=A0A0F6TD98_9CORY|nr:5-(carboxyamino)imidazole ribonucleotide synthase [Corynebacterium kutscheri]AKE40686.1 phosphoribosylaminoimidazole carboxylase, PurK protein [Corynebacterium kutscheri]VEH11083.1 Phosphoribosyl amino imidazole carboxylase ATPase subunit [Corynebacterium kutscheri]VEH80439.1 Phosphoribosyl amino imidazole carboxylase ATPase subunit [Corynebacterium kutscheri]
MTLATDTVAPLSAHAPGMPIVTVIGDGQLARMLHTEAIELGLSLRILASSPDSSAAQVTHDVVIGDYLNLDDLRRVADKSSVITFDHEHVPNEHLEQLISEGYNVQPAPSSLIYAQDKLVMRQHLAALGAPVPEFAEISSVSEARSFWHSVNAEVCIKARRGGYDGHGVWFPRSETELTELVSKLLAAGTLVMAEKKVPLVRELSTLVARTPSGKVKSWPVVESVQTGGICTETIAPAPGLEPQIMQRAQELAIKIATELGVTGVLAVELFETTTHTGETEIYVNELAMRPHNTGHWTQDGCVTSQFEQHIRAILDYPLGDTSPVAPVTVMVNVLGAQDDPQLPMQQRMQEVWQRFPEAKIHLYGKTYRAGRKLGHVNLSGTDLVQVRRNAQLAAGFLAQGCWLDSAREK